ncbi:MAG: ParB/RepB/Spo0J family partition protein, partial [Desulfobacterales bacterium]|nr:ParB/RepB/Spo0J family partition protein [Desulfobacterales bacterium]
MIQYLKRLFSNPAKDTNHVLSFNEDQAHEEDVEFIDHGIQTIPLERITGSVGKYHDFDSQFRPKKHISGKRFAEIKRTMREGKSLPPVQLYQIRNDYYVLDGNHRVAAAKELGWTDIKAKVIELESGRTTMDNLLYLEKKKFFKKTKLPEKITLTEVGKYNYLEKQIKKHQVYLAGQSGRDCDFQKAARDWYNTIYLPLAQLIETGELIQHFPGRTVADLYTYIAFYHWERTVHRRYGIGIDRLIPKTMEGFRKKMLDKDTPEYPEMKRTITAFILVDTDTTTDLVVLKKIIGLEEVVEAHSVHGSIDI